MLTYNAAIKTVVEATVNMPEPTRNPTKFIEWAEDICIVIAEIYEVEYEQVCEDLQELLGLVEDNE